MELQVIGSGSTGNSFILESAEGEAIILECGVTVAKIKEAIDFDLRKVRGALVTHAHGDHSKSMKKVMDMGIDVYANEFTHGALMTSKNSNAKTIQEGDVFRLGGFTIKPFNLEHDIPSLGFLIFHKEMGKTCFITDTCFCEYKFEGLDHIIIEANYSRDLMMERWIKGDLNAMVRDRVFKSHMEFGNTLKFLEANDLSKVKKIVLIHLSGGNADADMFLKETIGKFGIPVEVAQARKRISLKKDVF